jgi:hypothetical protein
MWGGGGGVDLLYFIIDLSIAHVTGNLNVIAVFLSIVEYF